MLIGVTAANSDDAGVDVDDAAVGTDVDCVSDDTVLTDVSLSRDDVTPTLVRLIADINHIAIHAYKRTHHDATTRATRALAANCASTSAAARSDADNIVRASGDVCDAVAGVDGAIDGGKGNDYIIP